MFPFEEVPEGCARQADGHEVVLNIKEHMLVNILNSLEEVGSRDNNLIKAGSSRTCLTSTFCSVSHHALLIVSKYIANLCEVNST